MFLRVLGPVAQRVARVAVVLGAVGAPLSCGSDEGLGFGGPAEPQPPAAGNSGGSSSDADAEGDTSEPDARCGPVAEPCRNCVNQNCCQQFVSCDDLDTCPEIAVCLRSCAELSGASATEDEVCLALCGADSAAFALGIETSLGLLICQSEHCAAACGS